MVAQTLSQHAKLCVVAAGVHRSRGTYRRVVFLAPSPGVVVLPSGGGGPCMFWAGLSFLGLGAAASAAPTALLRRSRSCYCVFWGASTADGFSSCSSSSPDASSSALLPADASAWVAGVSFFFLILYQSRPTQYISHGQRARCGHFLGPV